jgi:hypothetical protein
MKNFRQFAFTVSVLAVVSLFTASTAMAQKGQNRNVPPSQNKPVAPPVNSGNGNKNETKVEKNPDAGKSVQGGNSGPNQIGRGQGNARQMLGLPPRWVENLQDMSPQQQERFMKNNERFKTMSPEQQAQIRQRLQHWNSLSPQQRIQFRQQARALEEMTPQERQYVRQQLMPTWQNMPPARRMFMVQHVRQLDGVSEADRAARLNDQTFLAGLTPEEREMLPYLYRLRVGLGPELPPPPPDF